MIVGGDHINYSEDCSIPTADLLLVKILLNHVVSTLGTKFMMADIKNFYLNKSLKRYEYVRLKPPISQMKSLRNTNYMRKHHQMDFCTLRCEKKCIGYHK